jgi:23S rRNA pseudouridine1911/1915/1917 synthase
MTAHPDPSPGPMVGEGIHVIEADPAAGGRRLDRVIADALPGLSRSRVKALILEGRVAIAGATIGDPSRRVKPGDRLTIELPPPAPAEPEAQAIPLTVAYEDDDLIVVDKPAGLVVHPAPGNPDRTLVNALLAHCGVGLAGIGGVRRPGIVHRLDKDTSGLMVAAKTGLAHAGLSRLFAAHDIERAYRAVVVGVPVPPVGTIRANIGRNPHNRLRMAALKTGGKAAVTHYRVLRRFGGGAAPVASLVECRLETGRTHQIRVHLASIGHPVVGEPLYRGRRISNMDPLRDFPRQALHATVLGFKHPRTGEALRFESEMPHDIKQLISILESV